MHRGETARRKRKINREYFQTKVKPKNAQHHRHPIEFIYMVWDPFRLVRVSFFGSWSGSEFAFAFASVASKSVGVFVALPRPRSQHLRPSQQNQHHPPWTSTQKLRWLGAASHKLYVVPPY